MSPARVGPACAGRASPRLSPALTPGQRRRRRRLDQARQLTPGADLTDLIAYHEHKAQLLSRIAADLGTTEAHEVAADAWHYLGGLCRRADATSTTEVAP